MQILVEYLLLVTVSLCIDRSLHQALDPNIAAYNTGSDKLPCVISVMLSIDAVDGKADMSQCHTSALAVRHSVLHTTQPQVAPNTREAYSSWACYECQTRAGLLAAYSKSDRELAPGTTAGPVRKPAAACGPGRLADVAPRWARSRAAAACPLGRLTHTASPAQHSAFPSAPPLPLSLSWPDVCPRSTLLPAISPTCLSVMKLKQRPSRFWVSEKPHKCTCMPSSTSGLEDDLFILVPQHGMATL